jgi:hypothetical protein
LTNHEGSNWLGGVYAEREIGKWSKHAVEHAGGRGGIDGNAVVDGGASDHHAG